MFGAINIDLLATASGQATPDDSTPGALRRSSGGVGRNIAENLTRLGYPVSLISAVGEDEFGNQVLSELRQIGIDVSGVARQVGAATASYTAVHNSNGELLHAISDMYLFDAYQLPIEYSAGEVSLQQIITNAEAVVVDANLPATVVRKIASLCQSTRLYADGVSRSKCTRLSAALGAVTLLKVNRAEASALTGCESADDNQLIQSLHQLGPSQVLMTSGEAGVALSVNGKIHRADSLPEPNVVSTSGAGDAMLSGVIAASLAGLSVDKQLHCGLLAAAETLRVYTACSDKLSSSLLQQ